MKRLLFVFGLLVTFAAGVFLTHPTVQNVKADSDNPSVTICHGNTDVNNPYITETPNIQNDGSLSGGHQDHTGPIATSVSVAQALKTAHTQWGDIIPPYNFLTCPNGYKIDGTVCTKNNQPNVNATAGSYAGLNWTTDGQAIWNNDCQIPGATPTATPTPVLCNEDHQCPTPTPTATPTPSEPTATPTPGSNNNPGGGDDPNSCVHRDCNTHPGENAPQQAVLGASTMASTGTFTDTAMNLLAGMGIILMGLSYTYAKAEKKIFSR